METIFPAKVPATRRDPLVKLATEIFAKHLTGAAGSEAFVHSCDAFNLLKRASDKWNINIQCTEASEAHTAKLQIQI